MCALAVLIKKNERMYMYIFLTFLIILYFVYYMFIDYES